MANNGLLKALGKKPTKKISEGFEDFDIKSKGGSVNLFELFKDIWSDEKWSKYNLNHKKYVYFMFNRYMSINYPKHAALLSRYGLNGGYVVEFWKRVFKKQFKSMPNWIYTKTKNTSIFNKESEKLKLIDNFSPMVLKHFYQINNCSYKELNEAKRRFPDKVYQELKEIDDMILTYNKK